MIVYLFYPFNLFRKANTLEEGITRAGDKMIRMLGIDNTLKGEQHIVGIEGPCWGKPLRMLELHVFPEGEAIA